MPKGGEKLRPKQLDQPTTCEFQNFTVRLFVFDQNHLNCKNCSLVGEKFDYGKRGSFWHLIKFTLERSLDLPKQVFLI
jgi:formamidopyrimidine-DNA glycosylase